MYRKIRYDEESWKLFDFWRELNKALVTHYFMWSSYAYKDRNWLQVMMNTRLVRV